MAVRKYARRRSPDFLLGRRASWYAKSLKYNSPSLASATRLLYLCYAFAPATEFVDFDFR